MYLEADALNTYSLNSRGELVKWEDPQWCDECGLYVAEFNWTNHKQRHEAARRTFDPTLPVQGIQIHGLRADSKCPFDGCDALYRDFIGWYLHCIIVHSDALAPFGGSTSRYLDWKAKERIPLFRCTTCYAQIPVGQVQRHRENCSAWALPETVGALMLQRAAAYKEIPGLLKLEYGLRVIKERQLMGVFQKAVASATEGDSIEKMLCAIRQDPFMRRFAERNRSAAPKNVLYVVAKMRNGIVPSFDDFVMNRTLYVGQTNDVTKRLGSHVKFSMSHWATMGLTIEDGEELYLIRMSIQLDQKVFAMSFNKSDRRRLEQLVIDALGMGTLYNTERGLSSATLLNDSTYRNHLAPRMNQVCLVLFQSTHTQLTKNGTTPDNQNVWKLPVTRRELEKMVRKASDDIFESGVDSADDPLVENSQATMRVDQACSPIPAPRIFSPEVYEGFAQLQATRGYTDEQMLERFRAWRARNDTLRHTEYPEANELRTPAGEIDQSELWQLSPGSPDLFLDSAEFGDVKESPPAGTDHFDFDDVQTTSNGLDCHALEQHRASIVCATTSKHAKCQDLEEPPTPADEIMQSKLLRRRSTTVTHSFTSPKGSEVSAPTTVPNTDASGAVPLLVIGNRTMRIPSYGNRSTQYVDLDRDPVVLTQGPPSEASDAEAPREILDDSSESSLDEPSPTDSGVDLHFDFENVPDTGRRPVKTNAEDCIEEPLPKDSAQNAGAAVPSAEVDDEEADADSKDECAHKNCHRPQYDGINWVQCDDCDKWYHSLCIVGEEMEIEAAVFHCGCAKNGKQKLGRAQRSKKQ
ncbi:transcription factor 19-like protein [Aphelenchoides avenae]|nr:transcription factor 19-like protein [Aphelenchus avenae]